MFIAQDGQAFPTRHACELDLYAVQGSLHPGALGQARLAKNGIAGWGNGCRTVGEQTAAREQPLVNELDDALRLVGTALAAGAFGLSAAVGDLEIC